MRQRLHASHSGCCLASLIPVGGFRKDIESGLRIQFDVASEVPLTVSTALGDHMVA